MAMNAKCKAMVQAAAKAAGRPKDLTPGQLADIDSRIKSTARRLAYQDRAAWQALSADQRTLAAARQAMADIKAEAARKVANAQRQILKTQATEQRVAAAPGKKQANRLVGDIENTADYISGIKQESMSGLLDLMDAVKSGQGMGAGRRVAMWVFNVQNPRMTADLAREIFANADGHTGNAIAQKGAKAWLDTIETLRQRFNGAGGDVGKLDYGYLPQPHDAAKVRAAGLQKWVDGILPKLDRSRMLDENGVPLTDAAVRTMLEGVHETISSEGINKMTPGEPISGSAPGPTPAATRASCTSRMPTRTCSTSTSSAAAACSRRCRATWASWRATSAWSRSTARTRTRRCACSSSWRPRPTSPR
jgi:hypothetical protein